MNRSLLSLLVLGLILVSTASSGDVPKKVLKKLAIHQLFKSCWGEQSMKAWYKSLKASVKKCQGLTPTFDLGIFQDDDAQLSSFAPQQPAAPTGFDRLNINNPYEAWMAFLAFQQAQKNSGRRFRREAKRPTAAQIAEFKMDVMMFKEEKLQNLGNLTCVLADLGVLDANLNVNLDFYTTDVWREVVDPVDPDFKAKMIENYEDCYAIAESIPQAVLDKNPIYKKLGRHMIFFKCQFKAEINLCAKQEMSRYMEEIYGPVDYNLLRQVGLPADKFDAAYMKKKIKYMTMPESEKFVYKFMMTGGNQ